MNSKINNDLKTQINYLNNFEHQKIHYKNLKIEYRQILLSLNFDNWLKKYTSQRTHSPNQCIIFNIYFRVSVI